MEQRVSRFGVGPKTFVPAALYTLAILAAASRWPAELTLDWIPLQVSIAGMVLILAGVAMWIAGGITVMRAYGRDKLATRGVCGLCRHPIYSAWITLIFPGLALATRVWPLFFTPLIAYTTFKLLIHVEDEYLHRCFGKEYLDYRARVRELLPIPRW